MLRTTSQVRPQEPPSTTARRLPTPISRRPLSTAVPMMAEPSSLAAIRSFTQTRPPLASSSWGALLPALLHNSCCCTSRSERCAQRLDSGPTGGSAFSSSRRSSPFALRLLYFSPSFLALCDLRIQMSFSAGKEHRLCAARCRGRCHAYEAIVCHWRFRFRAQCAGFKIELRAEKKGGTR